MQKGGRWGRPPPKPPPVASATTIDDGLPLWGRVVVTVLLGLVVAVLLLRRRRNKIQAEEDTTPAGEKIVLIDCAGDESPSHRKLSYFTGDALVLRVQVQDAVELTTIAKRLAAGDIGARTMGSNCGAIVVLEV